MPCTFALRRDSTEVFSGVRRIQLPEEIVGFGLVLFETGNLLFQGLLSVVKEHRLNLYTEGDDHHFTKTEKCFLPTAG